MADGGVLTSKNSDKAKLIQRTTSETLRLTDPEKGSLSSSTPRKKTSFQITSVTVVSRTSNDGGEDSADDLDESHTEDISEIIENSRVTDLENETPSYSEDTFSKDDVFFNASSSLVSAPVIPTSSQYGLAILANHENSDPSNLDVSDSSANSEIRVEVNESSVVNLEVVSTKHDPEMRDMIPPAPRTERFKVVKIESTEPFKRGRWQCMDYLDAQNPKSENSDSNNIETNNINSLVNINNNNNNHIVEDHQPNSELVNSNMQTDNQQVNNQQIPINPPSNLPPAYTSVSPGQSLQNNMQMQGIINSAPQPQVTQQSQSLSQAHMQQILANTNQHQSLQPQQIQQVLANVMPLQQQQQSQQSQQTAQTTQSPQQQQAPQPSQPSSQSQTIQQPLIQSQPQQPIQQMQPPMQYQQAQQQPIQPQQPIQQQYTQPIQQQQTQQPQQMLQQQVPQQTIQQPIQPVHMQQMPIQQQNQGMMPQMQQMPQQVVQGSYSQSMPIPQQSVVTQTNSQPMMQPIHPQMQNYQQPMMTNITPQPIMNIQSQPHLQPQYYQNASMPQTTPLITSQGGMMPPMSQNNVSMQSNSMPPLQTFSSLSQQMQVPSMPQTPPVQTTVQYSLPMSMAQQPLQQMSQPLSNMSMQQQQQQQQPQSYSHSSQSSQPFSQVSSLPTSSVDLGNMINAEHGSIPAPTAALLESLQEVTASPEEVTTGDDPESLRGLARALATAALDLPQPSASGASAVAIDNKIEQAMDLVKSHLMFAVREEVEVLKEKIAELMERIAQLESENNVLRAGASPETLAQLPPPQPPLSSNPT